METEAPSLEERLAEFIKLKELANKVRLCVQLRGELTQEHETFYNEFIKRINADIENVRFLIALEKELSKE